MKLVYVLRDYTDAAGIERVVSLKANYLVQKGHEVHIVTIKHENKEPFFKFDSRIKFHDLALPTNKNSCKDLFIERLSDYLNEIKPDITISTGRKLLFYVCKATDNSKKVLEIHFNKYSGKTSFSFIEKYWLGRKYISIYYRKLHQLVKQYDRFVVLTHEDKQSWQKMGFNNVEVICNPLPFIPDTPSPLNTKRIIAIGRHEWQKGFDQLVKIWSKIENNYPDWILTIVGEGRKKAKLEKLISRLGIANRVELRSYTTDVPAEFQKSSVFTMTSNYEGVGMVMLEAMICGLPTVAYACKCGPRDVIQDGVNGFLVDFRDANQFANKLSTLLNSDELRHQMGSAAREHIKTFSIDTIMPKWINLFEQLTAKEK